MKKVILLLQFVIVSLICPAQTPTWLWAEPNTTGACNMDTKGLFMGPSGNLYIGGRFGGTMTLNGASATAAGTEIFSAKMDSAGVFSWITPHPYTNENDYDYGFGGDKHENTYVTGQTQGSNGLYIDKYNSAGNKVWAFDPTSLESGMGGYGNIAVDNSGSVYVTGNYGGSENFGPNTINAVGTEDIFLTKLDSNGNCKWAVSSGASGQTDGGRGVVFDPAGSSIYVCGSYNGTTTFNGTTANSITLPAVSSDAFFIAKYDTSGALIWVTTATNAGFNDGAYYWHYNGITVDSCSNVYVTGHFINTAQFGSSLSVTSNGSADIFVAKCRANGQWEWVQSAGGANDDEGEGIALDKHTDVYVTGYFEGTAQFSASQSVTTTAPYAFFVAKYANSNGDLQWVQAAGGSVNSQGAGVSIDKQGYVYVSGTLGDGTIILGTKSITGPSTCSIFVAKLDTIPPRIITPVVSADYCPGETTTLPYTITGIFNPGNTFTAQLSNDSGSFVSPVFLGNVTSNSNGTITILIPSTTPAGSNYLIRVVSDSPSTSSWANGCGAYYVNNVYVNVFYVSIGNNISVALSPIDTTLCSGGAVKLSAGGIGLTYKWSIKGDTTTLSKTDTFTVNPITTTTYYVAVSNGTCNGIDSVEVSLNSALPLTINITPASGLLCHGASATIKVDKSGTNYNWTPSTGLSAKTGDSISATPTVTTTYTVTGNDSLGCAVADSVVVAFDSKDTLFILPQPPPSFCSGSSAELQVSSVGTNFTWSPSIGLSATTGDSVLANPTVTTTYTISGDDSLGCAATGTEKVDVFPAPIIPTLTQLGDSLKSSAHYQNQWYFNGKPLTGDTSQYLAITAGGEYWVSVTNEANGCSSASDSMNITAGINQLSVIGDQLTIYPNPFNNNIFIKINTSAQDVKDWNLQITDVLGRTVYSKQSLDYSNDIDLSNLSSGMYFITVINKIGSAVFPVVRQN